MLLETPVVTGNSPAKGLNVSHQAAMKIIGRLETAGIVQPLTDRKRDRFYFAPQVIEILR